MHKLTLFLFITFSIYPLLIFGQNESVTVALTDKIYSLDTLSATSPDSGAERVRQVVYNTLVKKNQRFEYVGELAKEIKIDYQKLTITFILQNDVKFHNGKELTSADAKYTLDTLFQSGGYKAYAFYDSINLEKQPHILSIETPDKNILVLKVSRIELINQTLSNLTAIPIISEGTIEQQGENPVGTGAFKFVKFDQKNSIVELKAHQQYWEGSPKIKKLTIKTIIDSELLQDELQSGKVDIVVNPTSFSHDAINSFKQNPNLQVLVLDGANIRYIGFNTKSRVVRNVKFRQAVAQAIDREKIVTEILLGQGKVADSIMPAESWVYSANTKYEYNPAKAKKLLKEIGYKGQKVVFKIATGSSVISQYAQAIQNDLKNVGINAEIETLELSILLDELRQGKFQMSMAQWVGGNQDPLFLCDLFCSKESPDIKAGGRNRWRYSNLKFDKSVDNAKNASNLEDAKEFWRNAQEMVSKELPLIPLWYPANIVIANKRIGSIKISPNGDWSFIKNFSLKN